MRRSAIAALAMAGSLGWGPGPATAKDAGYSAEAETPLLYELPAAGSYDLPPIDRVGEHQLLDPKGERVPILGLPDGACALVAFVYLGCTDARGCPLALASLQRADRVIASRADLEGRVRLVTVSFDPARDTPRAMGGLHHHMAPKGDWRFLTAADEAGIEGVLLDYGQDAVPVITRQGTDTGLMRHVAKVFLVDSDGSIRNVYSSGFLDHRLLLRDIETLLAP